MKLRSFAALALLLACTAAPAAAAATEVRPAGAPQTLFLLEYSQGPAWVAGRPMQEQKLGGHVTYMKSLLEDRTIVAAGPFPGENGGMAVIRATDKAQAQAILARDPAVVDGIFTGQVRAWLPVFGSPAEITK